MSGRGAASAIGLWAVFNAALAAMLVGFRHNTVQLVAYFGAVLVLAVMVVVARRSREPQRRTVPEASAAALLAALAVALLILGAGIGLWAALIGAGLAVVAAVVLVRERAG